MDIRVKNILTEQTLVLVKPDAVKRGLIGVVLQRFENTGLKMVASKLIVPSIQKLRGHFPSSIDWVRGMGEKTLEAYVEYGIDPVSVFGSSDPLHIGGKIKEWNYRYLLSGPVFAMVLEGPHAIRTIRKLIGNTLPYKADVGTIRGDYSVNAPDIAGLVGSACKNLIHASSSKEEASQEISNWFSSEELVVWERTDEFLHFLQGEFTEAEHKQEVSAMNYQELEAQISNNRESNPRVAAEYAYVLAQMHRRSGNAELAKRYADESIALFDLCQMDTLEDCASRLVSVGDIALPSIIHQDVVRDRMSIAA